MMLSIRLGSTEYAVLPDLAAPNLTLGITAYEASLKIIIPNLNVHYKIGVEPHMPSDASVPYLAAPNLTLGIIACI
jgi:hypothetical protein